MEQLIISFLQKQTLDFLSRGANKIGDEILQLVNNRIRDYLNSEYLRNSRIKTILHRTEPVELESFYQPLYLRKSYSSWDMDNAMLTETEKINTKCVSRLFERSNCITIMGSAGCGKSTLVKHLFVNSIKQHVKIPIKVELRCLNLCEKDLLSYIKDDLIRFNNIAESDTIIERMLGSGKFIIFFDGFDEVVTEKKDKIAENIAKITTKYRNNYYILTSRPHVNIELLDNFANYGICELDKEERKEFVKKQFDKDEKNLSDRIIQTIEEDNSRAYDSFLSNPLLLSLFIVTYRTDSNVPQKRSDYYGQVFSALYSSHDTMSKLGFIRERQSGLSREEFEDILKKFSLYTFIKQKYIFSHQYMYDALSEIKTKYSYKFRNDSFLDDLVVSIGILTRDGADYTYPHRSMQEYFAAIYVASLQENNRKRIYEIFVNRIINEIDYLKNVEDYTSFISLLKETDPQGFKKYFSIPILHQMSEKVDPFKPYETTLRLFVTILRYSVFINDDMKNQFYETHHKCTDFLVNYFNINAVNHETRLKRTIRVSQKARMNMTAEIIHPFIQGFDFKTIINTLNQEIDNEDTIDNEFIESLY